MQRRIEFRGDGNPQDYQVNKWKHSRRRSDHLQLVDDSLLEDDGDHSLPLFVHPSHHVLKYETRHHFKRNRRATDRRDPRTSRRGQRDHV